ncbi:hypothetical protein Tsubulata_009138 [Turnera subulata]|uniref:Uncharacterized protein n=1 Tax=Turnera subulata TaxID=218843 RepID=A0A9Q0GC91_9ROSI|nr:hypothetical protein Tsubulata_009138 [Turnera subulata]
MSVRDLKSKGMNWVGNIYHKFETICHEVDSIVSQDTVKFVENQVQTVGVNMKKLYSNVIQDLMPPVKSKAQVVALKTSDPRGTCFKPVDPEDYGLAAAESQTPVEPTSRDAERKQFDNSSDKGHLVKQLSSCDLKLYEGVAAELIPEKMHFASADQNSGMSTEVDAFDEMLESTPTESFQASCAFTNHNHDNACAFLYDVPLSTSFDEEHLSSQEVGTLFHDPADHSFNVSYASSAHDLPEMPSSILSADRIIEFQFSNTSSARAESDMPSLAFPSAQKILEKEIPTSSSSLLTENQSQSENRLDNDITIVVPCSNPSNVASHDFDGSIMLSFSTSCPTESCKMKKKGLALSTPVLSLESLGSSDKSSYVVGDILDSQMENIDLTDTRKLEDICVTVNNSLLYEVSRRTRKSRSYKPNTLSVCSFKKKIQDSFTSKKRLVKEYEQLAILYDDLDTVPGQDPLQRRLSSGTTISLQSDSPLHQMHDSEWELL